ncbi:MMPL family transporter [Kocuria soli]|uniref:MMPL family transporter n=1 Tax=Kocuria soli TaxID=2485125 RepID=A0A3N3ZTM4_9MICC|nr:MMPL family transporter [Kocuria soli]ROZ64252.1 MMPL family transporter [Kocuria soli]
MSESAVAQQIVHEDLGGEANLVVLVGEPADVPPGEEGRPSNQTGADVAEQLRQDSRVESVQSFTDPGTGSSLVSDNGEWGLIAAHVTGSDQEQIDTAKELSDRLVGEREDGTQVLLGGTTPITQEINEQVLVDLKYAELIAVPLTMILLLIVFGSVVSAVLPLAVGGFGVLGAFFATWLITLVADVSIYSINLITALGLGLAIDYSLLMVSRFREELDVRGQGRHAARRSELAQEALSRTLATAGRTVLFTSLAVASALCALLVFPPPFLRSFGYGGIAVVVVAALGALVVLPALLAELGPRIDSLSVRSKKSAVPSLSAPSQFWGHVARVVYKRPLLSAIPVLVAIGVMAAPLLHVQFATPDDRILTGDQVSREAGDILRDHFPSNSSASPVGIVSSEVSSEQLDDYARRASLVEGVDQVMAATGIYRDGRHVASPPESMLHEQLQADEYYAIRVGGPADFLGEEAIDTVKELRNLSPPEGTNRVEYTGGTARFIDDRRAVTDHLLTALALIVATTFVLVFLFTGSVLMPLKALVMNVISLGAVLGVVTWIFQDGAFAELLGFTPRPLDMAMPVLLFCIAFGLSMDYELFLIGRMKEVWDRTKDNRQAVVEGLAHTGRITSLAAVVLSVTFAAFGTSQVTFLQLFGIGTAFAILLDATLVRGVLVPSFMRIAGNANWWSPGPLRKLHGLVGLSEVSDGPMLNDINPADSEREEDLRARRRRESAAAISALTPAIVSSGKGAHRRGRDSATTSSDPTETV